MMTESTLPMWLWQWKVVLIPFILDQETVVSAFDKWGLVGYKEDKPLISNVIVTQMGKKNNQHILQSKLDR